MSEKYPHHGILEIEYNVGKLPNEKEFKRYIEKSLPADGNAEPILSFKIFGKNTFFTFVRHSIEPSKMLYVARTLMPEVIHYYYCYSFKRDLESFIKVLKQDPTAAKYIGISCLPRYSTNPTEDYEHIFENLQRITRMKVGYVGRMSHYDCFNALYLLVGQNDPTSVDAFKREIDIELNAIKPSIILLPTNIEHHGIRGDSLEEKTRHIESKIPKEKSYGDEDWTSFF